MILRYLQSDFQRGPECDKFPLMRPLSALCKLLTILSLVGLVMGGGTPPAAGATSQSAMGMAMPEGMPPCEDMDPECSEMLASCPFQTVCAVKCPQATLGGTSFQLPLLADAANSAGNVAGGSSLAHTPPARPPKA